MSGPEPTSSLSSSGVPVYGSSVVVSPDSESLALAVAIAVVGEALRAVERDGRFCVALSGGSTPRRTYELLSRPPFSEDIPWSSTHVFWGDERCVSSDDPRSNEKMAREALLDHVPIPASQIHPMCCVSGVVEGSKGQTQELVDKAAREYEVVLRTQAPALDLVLLGLGTDGHTASLFPSSDAFRETERWVMPSRHDSLGRMTLTAPFINRATAVFFVVSGAEKAGVLRQMFASGPLDPAVDGSELPARSIAPSSGRLVWFVDEDAAAQIDRGMFPR